MKCILKQLVDRQKMDMMSILVSTKSKYDKLVRESNVRERQTKALFKRLGVLDETEFKEKEKAHRKKRDVSFLSRSLDSRQVASMSEKQNRQVLSSMVDSLKHDLRRIKEKADSLREENRLLDMGVIQMREKSRKIRQKGNRMHLEAKNIKNSFEREEKEIKTDIEYYEQVIKQKNYLLQLKFQTNEVTCKKPKRRRL